MSPAELDMIDQIYFDQLLAVAKREQAHAMRTALLRARIRIMHEDIFPAHMKYQEAA